MPATVFKTEAEFISALIWRFIVTGLLAGALGMLFSNGNVWASALFGAGISLLTLVGLQDRHVLRFDVHRSKHGWLRTMMLKPAPFGFKLPLTALAVAALFLLTWVSGSSKYALGSGLSRRAHRRGTDAGPCASTQIEKMNGKPADKTAAGMEGEQVG